MKELNDFICEYLSTPKSASAFIIIKPGFLDYADEIFKYCADKGFIMHDHTNPMRLTDAQIHKLYGCHSKEDWYDDLCNYMGSGDIIAAEYVFDHDKYPNTNSIALMKEINPDVLVNEAQSLAQIVEDAVVVVVHPLPHHGNGDRAGDHGQVEHAAEKACRPLRQVYDGGGHPQ